MWATKYEILAAASLLQTTLYVSALSGASYKWLKHSPIEVTNDRHQARSIYIANISHHFETVKKLRCPRIIIFASMNSLKLTLG